MNDQRRVGNTNDGKGGGIERGFARSHIDPHRRRHKGGVRRVRVGVQALEGEGSESPDTREDEVVTGNKETGREGVVCMLHGV